MQPPIPINLAVEDALSEAILRRILEATGRPYYLGDVYRRGGYGYLKKTISGWNKAAKSVPILVLADLDDAACPSALISSWLPCEPHPNLVFRIAVREVESWVLADAGAFAEWLRIKSSEVHPNPDQLGDPKATVIALAGMSPQRDLRAQIVPKTGSTATVGREYNLAMCDFVENRWNPLTAALRSPSLHRTMARLAAFTPDYLSGRDA